MTGEQPTRVIAPYKRIHAVMYARKWALMRNPLFFEFDELGGDCTNFVSQCVLAGSCVMNFTPDTGWYFLSPDDRAPAWTGVEFFHDFMIANEGDGPFGREVGEFDVEVGDVVQLGNEARFYHTLLISAIRQGRIYICAHSDDAYNRPLSTYSYKRIRFIHLDGVRRRTDQEVPDCFDDLYNQIPKGMEPS